MGEVILTMKGIDKSFPGVHALDHVDLEIRKGEVLALMGENGAGKSTLMKVLTGIYKKDSGTITYEGKEVEFANPRDAQAAGVVIVHQELNMMNHLTVAQNIFIGREIMNGKLINDAKMNQEAAKLFDRLNIKIDPTEKMGNLTVGRQQMCEIAKAISHDAKVIIFDEPSAALTEAEIEELFKIIRDLRDKGMVLSLPDADLYPEKQHSGHGLQLHRHVCRRFRACRPCLRGLWSCGKAGLSGCGFRLPGSLDSGRCDSDHYLFLRYTEISVGGERCRINFLSVKDRRNCRFLADFFVSGRKFWAT